MRINRKFALLVVLVLTPFFASAATIAPLDGNVVIDDEQQLFRYRTNPGLWQRSLFVSDQNTDSAIFEGRIYAITEQVGGDVLVSSQNGLTVQQLQQFSQTAKLLDDGENLYAVATNEVVQISDSHVATVFALPTHSYIDPENYLFTVAGNPFFTVLRFDGVDIFELAVSSTVPKWSFSCVDSYFHRLPAALVGCDNVVTIFPTGQPVELLADGLYVSGSNELRLWGPDASTQYNLYDGANLTTLLFSDIESTDQLEIAADRLFWRKTTGLFEVAWRSDPVTLAQLPANGTLRSSINGQLVFMDTDTASYYSKLFANWVATNLPIGLELLDTSLGHIAYKLLGSLAYYEATAGQFVAMDRSWAASSKIKTVTEIDGKLHLVLRNSSNNPNIYQSTDYRSWQRLTMPTKPTHLVPVSDARNLPVDTLVEVSGKISVLPGNVSSEISYLADAAAGTQIYLSQSKGNLGVDDYRNATAIGKVSSSQTGRIILDASSHLITSSRYTPIVKEISIAKALQRLALTHQLKGKISTTTSDTATLTDSSGTVKLHFEGIKEKFQNGDEILVEVVVDLNSSSGAVEAWYTGETAKLLKKAAIVSESSDNPTTATSTTISSSSNSRTVTAATPIVTSPITNPTQNSRNDDLTTKVAGVSGPVNIPEWLTFLTGLLAGGLVVRGTRVKKLFLTD